MVRAAEKSYDARALEARVRAHWQEKDAYESTRRARRGGEPWYFIDGPPYATGHIHLGTARNKVMKDAVVRWMRMRGFDVRDQPGYDMHGLPIEVKVEKELGFSSKKDIEQFGIDKFVERCRKFALDHERIMTGEFKELGVWFDWDRPYRTLDNEYMEGAWWAVARAHERGLLYEDERVLPWCWRCEAPLANAEVEFEDRVDPSVYVKFPVRERPREFLVVWTTTPWTLPANVAIAASPDLQYARVRVLKDGVEETLLLVEDQAQRVLSLGGYDKAEILETFKGSVLEGLRYEHPFGVEVPFHRSPPSSVNNTVILGSHVLGDRTGLVHTATGHGAEDFDVGKKYGIPVFSPVGEDGRYTDLAGHFRGLRVKGAASPEEDADARVLEHLRAKGALLHESKESHSYGHCWRCKNPIVYRATRQWFIDVAKVQDRMISETARVKWTPEWAGSARQMDWVRNAKDWCISRQRYWGIPLPVWKCGHCQTVTVVGTAKELAHVSPNYREGMDLHRPWIDQVLVACRCGARKRRVPDVLDVWFDSAVASWAQLGYPSRKDEYERWFPCDWIIEGLDQTRGWFYSQLGAGVASMDRVPYESVVMHGWVHDEQGRPFSKSLGNGFPPAEVIEKHGADALRLTLLGGGAPWENLSIGRDSARTANRTLNILWNVHVFATGYMALDGFRAEEARLRSVEAGFAPEDRWLYSRMQSTMGAVQGALEAYEIHRAVREVERFVLDDLSRWYVRLVRDRTWGEADSPSKRAAYLALHDALLATARLLAPFAPFVAEAIYQDLTAGRALATVHMERWPSPEASRVDAGLERDMALAREIVDAVANARHKANMKLRWPVRRIVVAGSPEVGAMIERLRPVLLDQANAKAVEFVGHEWEGLVLAVEPDRGAIGPSFRKDAPAVMEAIRAADPRELRRIALKGGPLQLGPYILTPQMLKFESRLPDHVLGASFSAGSVYVDTEVNEEIQAEGYARDLVRRIQEMRKEMALPVTARIHARVSAPGDLEALAGRLASVIAEETRSDSLAFVQGAPEGKHVRTWDLEGQEVTIGVTPVGAGDAPAAGSPTPAVGSPKGRGKAKGASKKPRTAPLKAAKKTASKKAASKKTASKKPKSAKKAPAGKPKAGSKKAGAKRGSKGKAGRGD